MSKVMGSRKEGFRDKCIIQNAFIQKENNLKVRLSRGDKIKLEIKIKDKN